MIVHRREEFRASKIMLEKAQANEKIEILTNLQVEEVIGEKAVEKIRVKNTKNGETSEIETEGFFLGIGHKPNTDIFVDQLEMDENGYLKTKADSTYTSVDGVFAAGDVQDHVYRQAITAAGTGCMAAIDCERWLEEHGL